MPIGNESSALMLEWAVLTDTFVEKRRARSDVRECA
jgi:hypothetical protein